MRVLLLLYLVASVSAWLPGGEGRIVAHNGRSLFGETIIDSRITGKAKRYVPASKIKLRGSNLGSFLIIEPWMAETTWSKMGCTTLSSEFDCVLYLGQAQADTLFQAHWNTWINQSDFQSMVSYGLNTVRIPVGYWIMEGLVNRTNEWFPKGGFSYLERVCGWAAQAGMFVIIDLHGAPGAQLAHQPSTGQYAATAGFYNSYNYERTIQFLEWMVGIIHTNLNFRTVGVLEILNEPSSVESIYQDLNTAFYPQAIERIQAVEASLNIPSSSSLTIQIMNANWGSGTPTLATDLAMPSPETTTTTASSSDAASSAKPTNILYDAHNYLNYNTTLSQTTNAYIAASCDADLGKNSPLLVGEWSLAVADDIVGTSVEGDDIQWYKTFFEGQRSRYESNSLGWIFWSWKVEGADWRWSFTGLIGAGVVEGVLGDTIADVC